MNQSLSKFDSKVTGLLVIALLWILVMASGFGVIYTTHHSRQLVSELEGLRHKTADLQVEWGQYLLEQSTWASYNRVEDVAVQQLNMAIPPAEQVVVIQ